ncbi:MAG: ABC transporter permease subunit [Sandaracinaceae bacterium]|nr:ABC transporter permease subunit [Sandaracinaceae bacterium]
MRRLGGLLEKELRHHGALLAMLLAFVGSIDLVLLFGASVGPRTITMLEAHANFTRVFLPLVALALGHRLVVREYHERTQRFLEALPVRRIEVLAVKLGLGLAVLGLVAALSLGASALAAATREPLTLRWLGLVALRTAAIVTTLWSALFAMGLLGRWRVPTYLAIGLVLVFLDQGTAFEVGRFGPFGLAGERLVLERFAVPWEELGVSAAIAAGALALAITLALVDEGSVAESLAKPMSRRERIAVGVVLALALIGFEVVEPRRDKPVYAMVHPQTVHRPDARVSVQHVDPSLRQDAEALADAIAGDLVRAREALGYRAPLGPVHVASRPSLPAHARESVALADRADGVLVRAPFGAPGFDAAGLRAWLLERVVDHATEGRAAFEPNAWVRAGSAALLVHERPPAPGLAAFHRRHRAPRYEALARYRRTEERFGAEVARALAASAAFAFVEVAGSDAWWAFAREVLAPPPPGVFAMLRPTARARFEAAVDPAAFDAAWERALTAPSDVPRARGWIAIEPAEGRLRAVRWGVRFEAPPPPGARCALAHAELGPFDEVLADADLAREEVACGALGEDGATLAGGGYGAGDRALFVVELATGGAPVRLLAERRELD